LGEKINKKIFWAYGGEDKCIQLFGGKAEGKRPLGRSGRRLQYNIEIDLQEVRCGMDLICLAK
jgi:hypothetical protein